MKSPLASITALIEVTYTVDFGKELTKEEMRKAFLAGDYDDIVDEMDHETVDVRHVEPLYE